MAGSSDTTALAPADAPSARGARALLSRLSPRRRRRQTYVAVTICAYALGVTLLAVKARQPGAQFDFAHGDGKEYYALLPSAIVDGDLDISNQMTQHWGNQLREGMLDLRTPRGYVHVKYPIGVALILLPSFLVAHGLTLGLHQLTGSPAFLPDGYSPLYQLLNFAWIATLFAFTMILVDHLIVRSFRCRRIAVLAAVLMVFLGGHAAYYLLRAPFYAHTAGHFAVVTTVSTSILVAAGADRGVIVWWQPPLLMLCATLAVLIRPTNVFVAPFVLYALTEVVRRGLAGRLLRLTPLLALSAIPVILQVLVWHEMTGDWVTYSYGYDNRFYFRLSTRICTDPAGRRVK